MPATDRAVLRVVLGGPPAMAAFLFGLYSFGLGYISERPSRVCCIEDVVMDVSGSSDRESGALAAMGQGGLPRRAGIAILCADPVSRRLVESASVQLEIVAMVLEQAPVDVSSLRGVELIVADEADAQRIREALESDPERQTEGINPAVVAVRQPDPGMVANGVSDPAGRHVAGPVYDGVLILPMQPAAVVAQLSLILYAHRAFAERYESAFEELHLNRRIFRSVTSGISVSNVSKPDLPLVYVNPAFEVMTGYCLEEVVGRNCRFLQGDEHDQPGLTLIREALRDQHEVTALIRNFRKDGSAFWNELSLSPIRNREGELTHFVGIQTDVTARVEFEAALRESEKLAAVGRLASSIAHEINNPLESLTNLLYLASNVDDVAETMRYLAMADKELQRVALITSQSLRFYKQSSRPQSISCTEMLKSVLDLYETRVEHAMIAIERRDRMTRPIVCLESEIRQVLNNLIRNSIDAMRGTGGRLLVRSREATDWRSGMAGVMMTIADTGSGISPQTMQHLFKPFFTTKGLAGTGLGLWVSSEIVTRHQGRLKVRSSQRPGRSGTIFALFLPFPVDVP